MLVNIINTILIACGMAVNTTNFNSVEKPYRKNANTSFNESYGTTLRQTVRQGDSSSNKYAYKYIIQPNNAPVTSDYYTITDSTYVIHYLNNQGTSITKYIAIYKIINYFNTQITINVDLNLNFQVNETIWYTKKGKEFSDQDLNNYYNITLTNNFETTFDTLQSKFVDPLFVNQSGTITEPVQNNELNISTGRYTLQPMSYLQIGFTCTTQNLTNTSYNITPGDLNVYGTVIAPPDIVTEIVDVPGLMFTVLTLPFSFISQAFDLTIFPDTPYQVNFTNLFLTLISIFLVLWLIKHIFK